MNPLVECVPNFSEGRRDDVIEAIVDVVRKTSGATLLDVSSDADHNRTVVTFVGSPEAVEAAAFGMIKTAAELIDLDEHSGEHPRLGATDVVPFIPIRDITMADCVAMAQRVGKRVGENLGIPVYLYERAATRPDRENLATIRKGEYEGLKEEIDSNPDRQPDYGLATLGKAGATVIGARAPLVAYNVYLNTDDVDTANKIAKAVRHSGGGLRFVKALGMLVEGQAQVSMNLTDFTRTPIHRVQEMIRVEAARYGLLITHSECVGLLPEQALIDSARWYLQLDLFDDSQILERRLQAAESDEMAPTAFLDRVAGDAPTPGGGSVAALAGALAGSLARMVAGLTVGKKKYAEVEEEMQAVVVRADELRARLSRLISEDSAAFDAVMAAYRMDKEDAGRDAAIQAAMKGAAEVPLETARLSVEVLEQLKIAASQGNTNAAIDAAVGSQMALAAIEGAGLNVRINLLDLTDELIRAELRDAITAVQEKGRALAAEVMQVAQERSGLLK